jgi:glycosyltransferase involved in cell wall biosynthesis
VSDTVKKHLLVEGSKLADEKMDGIKRYVAELLCAYLENDVAREFDVDVAVRDRVYPLNEIPVRYLPRGGVESETPPGEEDHAGQAVPSGVRQRVLWALGLLVPPILLHPIKLFIPDRLSRRVFGKPRAELSLPKVAPGGKKMLALLFPPVVFHFAQKLPPKVTLALSALGLFHLSPLQVDPEGYDLVHLPLPNNYHYLKPTKIPLLVTVHDLCHVACPEHLNRSNRVTLSLGLDRAVAGGASFVSVSEATREQMIRHYGLEPSRVTTVHSGCNDEWFHPVEDAEARTRARVKYRIPAVPFLLTLSTVEPRKNLAGTVRAFERLIETYDHPEVVLVIAGARGWKSRAVVRAVEQNRGRVFLPGYIDDADLAALYSGACGFIFASHYEGFGFPALEAMRCGVPVIYGDNSALPEIIADAGLPVNVDDVEDIARQLHRLLSDESLAESLRERARRRAAKFSWPRAACETVATYEKILDL